MKAKIFSFIPVRENSMIASNRIARFVSETLDLEICWDESIADEALDVLVIINGAFGFAGTALLEAVARPILAATRIVWIQNDYSIIPPKHTGRAESPFRKVFRTRHDRGKHPVDYWSTVKMMTTHGLTKSNHIAGQGSLYVNWNALTMRTVGPDRDVQHEDLVYYGAYRKDREKTTPKPKAKPSMSGEPK